ncbi:hypothetical protein SUGI_0342870 [Cryptomeria japonica]|nr:hypothetical protein SUGI_0342870 [Cryptomeria japonica]
MFWYCGNGTTEMFRTGQVIEDTERAGRFGECRLIGRTSTCTPFFHLGPRLSNARGRSGKEGRGCLSYNTLVFTVAFAFGCTGELGRWWIPWNGILRIPLCSIEDL